MALSVPSSEMMIATPKSSSLSWSARLLAAEGSAPNLPPEEEMKGMVRDRLRGVHVGGVVSALLSLDFHLLRPFSGQARRATSDLPAEAYKEREHFSEPSRPKTPAYTHKPHTLEMPLAAEKRERNAAKHTDADKRCRREALPPTLFAKLRGELDDLRAHNSALTAAHGLSVEKLSSLVGALGLEPKANDAGHSPSTSPANYKESSTLERTADFTVHRFVELIGFERRRREALHELVKKNAATIKELLALRERLVNGVADSTIVLAAACTQQ